MPGNTPQLSDIYLINFRAVRYSDAHSTARRSAVVLKSPFGTVGVIGRESKKSDQAIPDDHLYSPVSAAHKFDHEGYWLSRNYKSLLERTFKDDSDNCVYLATLTEPESTRLKSFVAECRRNRKML